MRFYHVRCMFAGLWRHDAAAAQMADLADDTLQREQSFD